MDKLGSIAKYDINRTCEMFQNQGNSKRFNKYDRVYFETNERCEEILSNFDFTDKCILTVLSSGDQAFQFYKHGAKSVDLFDINKLTIYYYYLRIWHMKKYGTMYPEWGFDNDYIRNLLASVKPNSMNEIIAYKYWSCFISRLDLKMINKFFYHSYSKKIEDDYDISLLLKKIDDDNFSFFNKDFSLPLDIPKKYDCIYTSNLSDYIKDERLKIYRDNLYNHLNKGGIVLSTNLSGSINCNKYMCQKRALRSHFKYKKISSLNEEFMERDDIGYSYKKRLIKRIM